MVGRVTQAEPLPELGFYGLPGHTDSPRDLLDECRRAEEIGLGACFISERFNVKEAASLTGAACAVTDRLGVATSVTNHNTRHPMVTAAWAATLHRLSGGRFSLGLGRGFDPLFSAIGLQPITMKQIEDFVGIVRRLWAGETILGHDGPAGRYPFLRLDEGFDEDIPVMLAALGPKTMTWGGGVFDGVMLHTFFTDQTLRECVGRIRTGAEQAGRDPNLVRVWAVLAVLTDLPEEARLKMLVGRMGTYLQAYGDALVTINGWDPKVLADFRAAPQVQEVQRNDRRRRHHVAARGDRRAHSGGVAGGIRGRLARLRGVAHRGSALGRRRRRDPPRVDPRPARRRGRRVPRPTTGRPLRRSLDEPWTLMARTLVADPDRVTPAMAH